MEYKIKIVTGFRDDQYVVIDAQEAHKAYYLFTHPEERAVFSNGVALIGKNIHSIEPAWNEIMGWNPTYKLTSDEWNDIRSSGVDEKMKRILKVAKDVSYLIEENPSLAMKELNEAKLALPEDKEFSNGTKMLADKLKM